MKKYAWLFAALIHVMLSGCVKPSESALPEVIVHKSATCGCCKVWAQHLRNAGFSVVVRNSEDLTPVKQRLGVPPRVGSCHTAEVGGYFIEGHVPVEDIARLLRERPDAKGLAVPGMPRGSPGMEAPPEDVQPYDVLLVARDDNTVVFAQHNKPQGGQRTSE
ncbi:MAG: DUF411 domain-containing protein [Steroidobacter sp.]|nr:DUF411 domain-containing protein [Steroidobacter sp.]